MISKLILIDAFAALVVMSTGIWLGLKWLRYSLRPAKNSYSPFLAKFINRGLTTVLYKTQRNKTLNALWWPQPNTLNSPSAVLMHGWGGDATNLLEVADQLHAHGWNVVLPDARSHGLSDSDDFSSLPKFAEDIEASIRWVQNSVYVHTKVKREILLVGHSLGGAGAILCASVRNDVSALISISSFSHPEQVMRRWLSVRFLPYWPIGWIVNRYIEKVIGFRFDDIAPIARLKNVTCPVLLIHGLQDDVVPIYCAEQLLESQPNAQLLRVEGTHEKFFDQDKLQVDVQMWLQHHSSAGKAKTSHIPFL